MWWYVYIIQHNITRQIYIGLTRNLQKRLLNHNQGETTATHRKTGKWLLVYTEVYRNKKDAAEREKKLKYHGSAKHELLKRIKRSLI